MPDVVSSNPLHRFRVVLLAAGQGSRLGGLPKSLLRLHDQTLLERQLRALIAAGATHIVVVTGFYYPEIEAELARFQPQPQCSGLRGDGAHFRKKLGQDRCGFREDEQLDRRKLLSGQHRRSEHGPAYGHRSFLE